MKRGTMYHGRPAYVLLMGALVIGGCADQGTEPLPLGHAATLQVSSSADDRPDEAEMTAFAREVPGLAGYHFERGELVVGLTAAGRADAARAALASVAARGSGRMRVRTARYTFLELQAWRDAWWDRILDVAGVTFVDLDEVANQVVVGVAEPGVRARVLELLRPVGIPVSALGFAAAGYPRSHAEEQYAPYLNTWPTQGDSITAFRRPLEGGLKITYRRAASSPDVAITCTLGFIARINGVRVAITASHCSQRHWDLEQTVYFQSTPGVGRYFGYEYRDPNGSSCGFLSINVCRNADASAVALEPGVADSLGHIVRPIGPPPIGRSEYLVRRSSLLVDPANPRFRIVGTRGPLKGEWVDKVGATTGWTRGDVDRTCVDMPADRPHSKLRCQTWARFSSTGGDSGGPVFVDHLDGTVTLLGMVWGKVTENGQEYATFSSIGRIQMDLGDLQLFPSTPSGGGGTAPGGSQPGPEPGGGDVCCIN
ncbi:MAG: S1 family peptidase [Thioalkalivibrio sp.]|nr:S1 family peptidase [Thioalkalivibrio sp.]